MMEQEMTFSVRGGGRCAGLLAERGTRLAVVACHPWGPLGGSMWDIVVDEVVELFGSKGGLTTLRFNFRSGLGRGRGSVDDVRGACAHLLTQLERPPERILLVGYSYGSLVVAAAADDIPEVVAFACVSPPLYWAWALFMCNHGTMLRDARRATAAKLLLVGEHDNFCSVRAFNDFAESLPTPKHAVVLRGYVDHFNVYRYAPEQLERWACAIFGVSRVSNLAASSGEVVRTVSAAEAPAAPSAASPTLGQGAAVTTDALLRR